jgi:hypothetical protein
MYCCLSVEWFLNSIGISWEMLGGVDEVKSLFDVFRVAEEGG